MLIVALLVLAGCGVALTSVVCQHDRTLRQIIRVLDAIDGTPMKIKIEANSIQQEQINRLQRMLDTHRHEGGGSSQPVTLSLTKQNGETT